MRGAEENAAELDYKKPSQLDHIAYANDAAFTL